MNVNDLDTAKFNLELVTIISMVMSVSLFMFSVMDILLKSSNWIIMIAVSAIDMILTIGTLMSLRGIHSSKKLVNPRMFWYVSILVTSVLIVLLSVILREDKVTKLAVFLSIVQIVVNILGLLSLLNYRRLIV